MKQEKNTLKFANTSKGIVATLAEEIADNEYITCFGIYWDECDDMSSIGLDIVDEMMKQGRIKEAKVISITKVNGSPTAVELVVSFYGESGKQYELTVYTFFANVMKIEVGQYIQCYVNGETGYIDTHNIKVVREKEEEINFE